MTEAHDDDTNILVVDDEESLRLTFKMFLTREGYGQVTVAATFEEAMALIEQRRFDLIISDIVMEGASGIDLLRRIKELDLGCPVVMVTGYPNINTATEAVRLGAFDYLPKPVKKNDLLRTARMALQQHALWKEKEALQEEKERYRQYLETIFRSVRDKVITVDTELRIEKMNEAAVTWARKYVPELAVDGSLAVLPKSFKALVDDVRAVLETGEEVHEHRVELDFNGGRSVFRISAAPLESSHGVFLGAVLVCRDVSRLEALEQRGNRTSFHRLIGSSVAMQTVYTLIENVGRVDTTVLVTGESGTGKELVAEALHAESARRDMPLVKVDCTSIPENLLESELFGHKKGAFTGADSDRKGRILQADGGTLFLDEIGDISQQTQLRLLRFLQERTFYPVGKDQPIKVDVRVIAATNADLKQKVLEGHFREDLYYRLKVVDIVMPPLREREGDLPLLVNHFMERFSRRLDKEIHGISDQALAGLENYEWPGNVRELEHVIERASVLCTDSTITVAELPDEILHPEAVPAALPAGGASRPAVREAEAALEQPEPAESLSEPERIMKVLKEVDGNKAKAARRLAMDRSTLYRKMRLYGIDLSAT